MSRIMPPPLSILSTPVQEEDGTDYTTKNNALHHLPPSTPSPQAVDEFETTAITSANRSALVSRMLSDHLVTVNDDEVIESSYTVSLPELDGGEITTTTPSCNGGDDDSVNDIANYANHAPLTPNTLSYNSPLQLGSTRSTRPRHHIGSILPPSRHIQHKMLYQSVSSLASPPILHADDTDTDANAEEDQLYIGPERTIQFHTESLGIKLSRHTDGYVRVLSVTPYRPMSGSEEKVREGEIYEGDVVREVSDVNLRGPIDSAVWKLTVGLIRMAPRPLKFVVAEELLQLVDDGEEEEVDVVGNHSRDNGNNLMKADQTMQQQQYQQQQPQMSDIQRFGPTRTIHFFDQSLGVKLHHNSDGYVQILSIVTPYESTLPSNNNNNSPSRPIISRTGIMKEGDVVLEVGGVWDLRNPIEDDLWGVLVRFIRETRRPLCMVVADGDCLGYALLEEEEEEHQRQQGEQSDDTSGVYSDDDDYDEVHGKVEDIIKVVDGSDDDTISESSEHEELPMRE
mmetsp:Transcript_18505/g.38701  ORF Transcript_18505/g.38701 Transcript_18505/m.38701 type:complete len:511 (-) Transcript_18505:148-1680(-)